MAYDEYLADRIRNLIKPFELHIIEKPMFGGLSFLYKGKMSVGIIKSELCVRYLKDKYPNMLKKAHVRPMDFTKKPMKEMLYASQEAFENDEELKEWIRIGIEHAESKAGG